ncbi:UNVERIFIED_CONTAM: hypothetical protein GTU68_009673 [Idotea baltica]|nr:hypothetical protein [Idotea baltica]
MILAYGRWSGLDSEIKQGEYWLPQYLSIEALLARLSEGKVIQRQLTFPEGITLRAALDILVSEDGLTQVLDGTSDPKIQTLIAPHSKGEGLFFPDSYQYQLGDTDWDILQRAFARMDTVLDREWRAREPGLPYDSAYEALIMASIIERETGLASERTEIAGVFVRRLQKRMRLQTDPTVIYGLGENYQGNLRRSHLLDSSNLYNTYRHSGLPPSPIALPGQKAIRAALHPAEGDTLFFVARGDGSHQFSTTLKQHEKAVREFQLKRRADYRSSPKR